MIEILSGITESMRRSKQSLDDLQEASSKASGNKSSLHLRQLIEIRQGLQIYWSQVANFMQVECFQTVNAVIDLQDTNGPSDLMIAIQRVANEAEDCSLKAKTLVKQDEAFMQIFRARNIRFPGSNALTANFMHACDSLRAGLIDLLGLIDKQREACAAYQEAARAHYRSSMLDEFKLLGKQWQPYAGKAKETHSNIKKLSNDIVAGVKQPTGSKSSKGGCIIM